MKDKIKEQIRMMQERNINRVYIPNGDFRRLEIMIARLIKSIEKRFLFCVECPACKDNYDRLIDLKEEFGGENGDYFSSS